MAVDRNKDVVRGFITEVLSAGQLARIDEFLAPNYVNRAFGVNLPSFKEMLQGLSAALPERRFDIEELIAEGNAQLKDPNGSITRADRLEALDDFRDAFVQSLSVVTHDDTRIAADKAVRREGNVTEFERGRFTPCKNDAGMPPLWCLSAARIVHEGCRKVVNQYLTLQPVLPQSEGDHVTVPAGFDAQRTRLTGNVAGQPPYTGTLRHHGWVTTEVKFPSVSPAMDPRVLAPAEVELA